MKSESAAPKLIIFHTNHKNLNGRIASTEAIGKHAQQEVDCVEG